ncbi:MAG: hypothetical protein EOL97_07080 [Spirochaetia bacterium]|nr:hypothetical protein [Spirochaetia bacterium]
MLNLQGFIITVVVVGVTLVVGIYIASEISSQMTADSAEYNASTDLVTALSNGTGWIAILVVVGFATIILALLSSGLSSAASGSSPVY